MSELTGGIVHRAHAAEIVVRDADGDGRTLYGRIMPYGEVVTVDDGWGPYQERFAPGAFARSIAERGEKVRLFTQHNRAMLPVGKAVEFNDGPDGLDAAFRLFDGPSADDALAVVRGGGAGGFSVGFRAIAQEQDGDVTVRTEAALSETSIVTDPAYPSAQFAGIRSALARHDLTDDEVAALEQALRSLRSEDANPTPDVAPPPARHGNPNAYLVQARKRLAQLQGDFSDAKRAS